MFALGALALFGCARLVLGPNYEAWLGLDPRPRAVRVELDPSLSSDGAWRVGSNPPPPGTRLDGVEVVLERLDSDSVRVAVHATWDGQYASTEQYASTDELWLDFDAKAAPLASAKSSSREVGTPNVWHSHGLHGFVRLNATSLVPPTDGSSTFVLTYEIEGWNSGSDVVTRGKVAFDLNQLR